VEGLRVTLGRCTQAGGDDVNQDFDGAILPQGFALSSKGVAVAIADGIGSSRVSQVASAAAVRTFLDDYYATSDTWSVRRSAERVLAAVNAWLHAQNQRGDARFDKDAGYVCTFSALVAKGRDVHLFHVGDARIYRVHACGIEQLTDDHRVAVGGEGFLGRALGVSAAVKIDYRCIPAEPGAVYLLATDGAWHGLDGESVRAALDGAVDDLDGAARRLVEQARRRGSADDATALLVRVDALPDVDPGRLPLERDGLALPPPLAPGMRFEGHTIVRTLHTSARSHVHLAVDDASGVRVVLKTPSVDMTAMPDYLDRFVLEEWVARRLRHPNVARAAADTRARSHLFVAMDYIEGQTLAQWMIDHPKPSLDAARRIVVQVAAGLEAFHGREMLHQDLRPQNVIIDRDGTARLLDFASAYVAGLAETSGARSGDAIAGTLQYTAPEYFVGGEGTPRSEVFALAVVLYEMLTGALPYGLEASRLQSPAGVKRLRYVPLRMRRPDLPAWLDNVLQRALSPDPDRRQEAMSEFAHDLTAPGPAYFRKGTVPLIERHPLRFWQVLSAGLLLAVLALAGMLVSVQPSAGPRPDHRIQRRTRPHHRLELLAIGLEVPAYVHGLALHSR